MNDFNSEPTPEKKRDRSIYNLNPKVDPAAAGLLGLIGIFFLYQLVGGLISLFIFGMDIQSANQNALRLMTAASQMILILIPAIYLAKLIYEDVTTAIRFKLPSLAEVGIFTLGIILLTPLLQSYMYLQTYLFELAANNSDFFATLKETLDGIQDMLSSAYSQLLTGTNLMEMGLIVFVVSVVPAICEEVFFRGFVQTSLELKTGAFKGALITAVVFGLYHMNFYGLLPLIGLGLYFGYATYKSNSILVAILLHFLNNFVSYIAFLILGEDELSAPTLDNSTELLPQVTLFILLAVVFAAFIYLVNKYYSNKNSNKNGGSNDMP